MKSSKKEEIICYAAKDLFNIVLDIEKYPEYIPWCRSVNILSKSNNNIIADLIVKYKFFTKTFKSSVNYNPINLNINVIYISGPLKDLKTNWKFERITNNKTKVIFSIEFEFTNILYQKTSELFYNLIESKMINSFKKRADEILN